jgi:hypothetical protein
MIMPTAATHLHRRLLLAMALLALVFAASTTGAAWAAEGQSFTLAPSPDQPSAKLGYFVLSLSSGQQSTQRVMVRNDTAKSIAVELAPIDTSTTPVGGVAYLLSGQSLKKTGTWLALSERRVQLAPGEVRQVDVTVTVPAGAQPGDYVAGVSAMIPLKKAAADSSSAGNKASVQVNLQTRRVIAVQVEVPGSAVPKLTISGVTAVPMPNGMDLAVGIASPGGKFTKGTGTIDIPSTAFTREFPIDLFVPGTSIAYPIEKWQTAPQAGTYPAHVVIRYGDKSELTAEWSGDVVVAGTTLKELENEFITPEGSSAGGRPWLMYGLIGGLVIVVLIMGFALLRRRRPEPRS